MPAIRHCASIVPHKSYCSGPSYQYNNNNIPISRRLTDKYERDETTNKWMYPNLQSAIEAIRAKGNTKTQRCTDEYGTLKL